MAKKRRLNRKVVVLLAVIGVLMGLAVVAGIIAMQPKDPETYAKRGADLLKEGKYADAVSNYIEAARESHKPEHLVALGKAMLEWRTNDPGLPKSRRDELFREARNRFIDALRYDPKHLEAQRRLTTDCDSLIAYSTGDWLPYVESLDRLITLVPEEERLDLMHQRAVAKNEVAKSNPQYVALALEDFKKLVQLAPQQDQYWRSLAFFYLQQKQKEQAEAACKEGLKANPKSVNLRLVYADFLTAQNRKGEALPLLKEAIGLEPKGADGYLALASYYQRERQVDQALATLQQAVAADPSDYRPYATMAHILEARNASADAEAALNKGMEELRKLAEGKLQRPELRNYLGGLLALNHELADLLLDRLAEGGQRDKILPRVNQALQEMRSANQTLQQMRAVQGDSPAVWKIQGRIALIDGHYVEAERLLRTAYDNTGGLDPKTAELLIGVYRRLGQLGEAERIIDRVLKVAGDDPAALLYLVRLYVDSRQYDKADKVLGRLAELQPNNELVAGFAAAVDAAAGRIKRIPPGLKVTDGRALWLFLDRARELWREGDQADAVQLAQDVLSNQPRHLEAIVQLIQWHKDRNDLASAQSVLRQALEVFKDDANVVQQLSLMLLTDPAQILAYQLQLAQAEKDPVLRNLRMAEAYRNANQTDRYYEHLKKAEAETKGQVNPVVVDALFDYALAKSDWDSAEKYARAAVDANLDEVNGRMYQARLAQAQQKWDEAIRLTGEALRMRPRFSDAHAFLGSCYLATRQLDQAQQEFETAYNQNPANVNALRGLVRVSEATGKAGDYAQWVTQAYKFLPNDPELRERYLQLKEGTENPQKIIPIREEERRVRPRNMLNLVQLATLYARVGRNAEAEAIYRQMLADSPAQVGGYRLLANFLRQTNRDMEARNLLAEYTAKAPDKVAAYMLWGDYLDEAGDAAGAKAVYEKGVAADPKDGRGYLALANLSARRALWSDAADYQQKYLDRAGERAPPLAERQLVEFLVEAGRLSEAQERLGKLLAKDPADSQLWTLRGKAYLAGGDLVKAKESVDRALRDNPGYALALAIRAEVHLARKDMASAIADLEDARKVRPQPSILLRLAETYARMDDFVNAQGVLQGVLSEQPDNLQALRLLVAMCLRFERWPAMEQALNQARKAYPAYPEFLIGEERMWRRRNDPVRAVAAMDAAVKLAPENADIGIMRMQTLVFAGRYDQAITAGKELRQHPVSGPVAEAVLALAEAKRGDLAAAETDFAEAVKQAKDDRQIQEVMANIRQAYPPDQALEKLTRWQRLRPNDWRVLDMLSSIAQDKGDQSAAVSFLNQAMGLVKSDSERAAVLRHLGLAHQLAGQLQKCEQAYREALKIEPKDGTTLNNLAMLLSKDPKRLDEALAFAKQAAEIMPNEPNVLDTYGMVLMMKGQLGEAEKVLNRSLDIQATPASRLNLGAVHEKLGRKSDALRQYQLGWELIKNSPSDPYYRELQEALKRLSK